MSKGESAKRRERAVAVELLTADGFEAGDRLVAVLQAEREEWAKDNSRLADRYRDGAQAILLAAYRRQAREARARCRVLEEALETLIRGPHTATSVDDGLHSDGFCKTCADQYVAASRALSDHGQEGTK